MLPSLHVVNVVYTLLFFMVLNFVFDAGRAQPAGPVLLIIIILNIVIILIIMVGSAVGVRVGRIIRLLLSTFDVLAASPSICKRGIIICFMWGSPLG